jgi:DNA-binding protein H-NS
MASKIEQLKAQMAELAAQIQIEESNALAAAFSKIDKIIADSNIKPEQLIEHLGLAVAKSSKKPSTGTKAVRASPRVTHQDPANPNNVWTSRGRPAKWLQAYIDQGRSKDEFLVK